MTIFKRSIGWIVLVISLSLYVGTLVISPDTPQSADESNPWQWLFSMSFVGFGVVGALVLSRDPKHKLGWIISGITLTVGSMLFTGLYSRYAIIVHDRELPFGEAAAWVTSWIGQVAVVLVLQLIILFPNGRARSSFWRRVSTLVTIAGIALALIYAFRPGPLDGARPLHNPFGIASVQTTFGNAIPVLGGLLAFILVLSVFDKVWYFHRSRGIERQQLKWFALSAASFPLFFGAGLLVEGLIGSTEFDPVLLGWFISFNGIAAGIGIAIFKYRLYDIDVILNRALVYGALTAVLGASYVGVVAAVGSVAGESNLTVAAATLAVAGLFQPVRRRIQSFIDQRFYRRKYDAQRTIDEFASRLRDEVDLESLARDLVGVVDSTMQPTQISVWMRSAT